MKAVSAAKVAAQFGAYLEASREQPVLVTQNGKPVAVLMAVDNKAEAEQLARGRPRSLRSIFQESHERIDQGRGIPNDEFWQQVEQMRRTQQRPTGRGKKA